MKDIFLWISDIKTVFSATRVDVREPEKDVRDFVLF